MLLRLPGPSCIPCPAPTLVLSLPTTLSTQTLGALLCFSPTNISFCLSVHPGYPYSLLGRASLLTLCNPQQWPPTSVNVKCSLLQPLRPRCFEATMQRSMHAGRPLPVGDWRGVAGMAIALVNTSDGSMLLPIGSLHYKSSSQHTTLRSYSAVVDES